MRRFPSLFVLAAVAFLALASCGKAAEKISEKAIEQSAGGGDADINDDGSFSFENDEGSFSVDKDGNVKIEGEDGEFSIDGGSGELPEGFPDDIPLPDDYEILTGSRTSDGDSAFWGVVGEVSGDPEDVFAALVSLFEDADFESQSKSESESGGDFFGSATFLGGGNLVSVSVTAGGDGENATVAYNVQPDGE